MQDPRIDKLAEILVTYSCRVQRGENVLIEAYDITRRGYRHGGEACGAGGREAVRDREA